ncbi:heavy metal translocating P-type ATPase metal-binding domain-containing protein [Methylomonas sp. MED-D]|uniref:heavy metal translocating P-type ATPase metal-binding domain-containing protein n=1 Tax=Methylomonas TaxID=416 RepID=UPI0009EDF94A|nr:MULTISPECIES: heavy metal translocating P-type ATPase metal-binding domain-containing protein [Methylomonas]MDT4331183.1 heavy metal translocating P-type ATPase metal-binding domain-containing protein [Methylomonas sp. MV1]NJA08286.1 metal-binding protein [Methylococcaceae bacterium WWC4]
MATTENDKNCDLCGLTVEVSGFELKTVEGDKQFCCEGCKGIFQMLHEELILPDDHDTKSQPTRS